MEEVKGKGLNGLCMAMILFTIFEPEEITFIGYTLCMADFPKFYLTWAILTALFSLRYLQKYNDLLFEVRDNFIRKNRLEYIEIFHNEHDHHTKSEYANSTLTYGNNGKVFSIHNSGDIVAIEWEKLKNHKSKWSKYKIRDHSYLSVNIPWILLLIGSGCWITQLIIYYNF